MCDLCSNDGTRTMAWSFLTSYRSRSFPACGTNSHNPIDGGIWHKKCVGSCLCRAGSAAFLKLLSFISSLQPFRSKFAMFSFASSCIYGMFLVKVVLLFQKTEMRDYLTQILLRDFNIFKCLALQSEFFTAFLFDSLQSDKGHVQRETQVPCFANFGKYAVVVEGVPPSFGLWTQKQWKSGCSCHMKLLFIISPGNSICNGIKSKLLLICLVFCLFFSHNIVQVGEELKLAVIFFQHYPMSLSFCLSPWLS